jgi:hypothetical protein
LLFQTMFLARSEELPDVVVAGATLVVAAAFQPLRRRVQALVDRRFNRRVVDAAAAIDRFGVRLRSEVDAAAVATDLRAVADRIVQPAAVGVWLRG